MKALILAGGKGSRLHPVTLEIPKPLIPIRKRPLINYNLALFVKHGVSDIAVLIRPDDRKDYERWAREYGPEFSDLGMRIQFIEEPEPMGTFGYFYRHLRDWVGDESVFVSNGDEIKNIDLRAMVDFHVAMELPATLALVEENQRKDCGFVLVRENKIQEFFDRPDNAPSNLMSAGLYVFSPAIFDYASAHLPTDKKVLMFEADLFPKLAKAGQLAGFTDEKGTVFDCGTFERWEKAIREA